MKLRKRFLCVVTVMLLSLTSLTGCGGNTNKGTPPPQTTPPETTPDVTTTASIVDTEEAFLKAISSTGTWIICTVKDMTINKDLVLDGEFKNGKKDDAGKDIIQRKIALYAQDDKRNVTARYNLTAPKLTVLSPNARIQSGTFKGDVYVSAKNFQLVDAKIEGNLYFTTDDAQATFTKDDTSSVTGKTELRK
jgi:predicted small lipoprotein YifL